jgi:hypothetical protein
MIPEKSYFLNASKIQPLKKEDSSHIKEKKNQVKEKDVEIKKIAPDKISSPQESKSNDLRSAIIEIIDEVYVAKNKANFKQHLIKELEASQPSDGEAEIFRDILNILAKEGCSEHLGEILCGAHVRLEDSGEFYNKWKELPHAHARISSHDHIPDFKQYGLAGDWFHEILFGIVMDQEKPKTFFQLEATPWKSGISNRVGHTVDAIKYVVSGKNIGPYGKSAFVEKAPIRIPKGDEMDGKKPIGKAMDKEDNGRAKKVKNTDKPEKLMDKAGGDQVKKEDEDLNKPKEKSRDSESEDIKEEAKNDFIPSKKPSGKFMRK